MSRWSLALRTRIYGEPPGPGAPQREQLRYVRRILVRGLLGYVVLYALAALLVGSTVVWISLGAVALLQLCAIGLISWSIRREGSPSGLE